MRPAAFATLCLGLFVACEPDTTDTTIDPVTVQWMDWPAEVNAGQPFRTRLVVWNVCALEPQFRAGASADQSAVTFAPYFLVSKAQIECLTERTPTLLVVIAIDTAGTAPGLAAPSARTYEMRGSTMDVAYTAGAPPLPVGTYGDVTVRPSGADPSRRNAGGYATLETDSLGCVRLRPTGLYSPGAALVLEDQADTAGISFAFVKGYIHDAATPVCGETKVFHLVSRN
jgi:hypothetical protein